MAAPVSPFAHLAKTAAARHGVVSIEEAQACGLTRSQVDTMVKRGEWTRPRRGVLVSNAVADSWYRQAAIAALSTSGVLSHRAGGFIHRLDGIRSAPIELTKDRGLSRAGGPWLVHTSSMLTPADYTMVKGLPVTTLARTVIDLGRVFDDDVLEQVLDDAFRKGLTQRSLDDALDRLQRPGPSGTGNIIRILSRPDRIGPLPDSKFERLVERACVQAGLPVPQRQLVVRDAEGRIVARLDMAWPEAMLGVEADSVGYHGTGTRIRSDNRRDLLLASLGWEMVYVGWDHLRDPAAFTEALRVIYNHRLGSPGGRPTR